MRVVRWNLTRTNEFRSRLSLIISQNTEKIADVRYICKSTENRRRVRKLEKEKLFDFQMGKKDGLHNLRMGKLYREDQCISSSLINPFVITLERIL